MIRINHITLPAGLSAFARRDPAGDLEVFVSATLSHDRQRAAVRMALRASRRAGWRGALLPVPVAALLTGGHRWLGRISRVLRLHPLASAATATLTAAAGVAAVAVLPQQPGHVSTGQLPAPAAVAPPPGQGTHSAGHSGPHAHQNGARPHPTPETPGASQSTAAGHPATQAHGATPEPGQSTAPGSGSSPQSSPSPSTSQPSPTPSPTHSGNNCITVLGITVCL
jgi:hypothetical protein